ncbi:MAG: fumarylacetoacetate hydrolase family protein [Alphaproteobacteria bacterium]|nr:fumarylacetoacetate hydrolase family protein [Alphaproteobacteria bacterium]
MIGTRSAAPGDGNAVLLGRAWRPDVGGPSIVTLRGGEVIDITAKGSATARDVCELEDPAGYVSAASGPVLGTVAALLANSDERKRDHARPWFLAPIDLQAIKAAGVTFVDSLLERVIEEQARGAPEKAADIRREVMALLGGDLRSVKPGSEAAARVKAALVARGAWSQYLEVGIGPDAEIFTKAQPLSAVGAGASIGILADSRWNNPEPELVLAIDSRQRIKGVTLGNDVNLRDWEGRSALLLGRAKDNNASCAIGPFIRLFDPGFGLDRARRIDVAVEVEGEDRFRLTGTSPMPRISRDFLELAAAAMGEAHRYPDGLVLFVGTMFAPIQDRDRPGEGFTHKPGDVVSIAASELGCLSNRVALVGETEPWSFGLAALMRNLAARGLL